MKAILKLAVALAGFLPILPAQALTADGLTDTLTAFTTATPDVDNFTLTISGINGSSDTERGRDGVFALAFNAALNRDRWNDPPGLLVTALCQPVHLGGHAAFIR
jgi:hypothetical protein